MSRVVVHIDRLAVSGPADARAVEAAVRAAVTQALARPGAAEQVIATGSRAAVNAGRVRAGDAAALGAAIGRGIVGGKGP